MAATEYNQPLAPYETGEALPQSSDDLRFAVDFVRHSGRYMLEARTKALVSEKLDRTLVTDVDTAINTQFIDAVRNRSGKMASVIGEEDSAIVEGSEEVWIIDPVDGTGEYVDPGMAYTKRTSCVGAAMFRNGESRLSVVLNPFRQELFVADRQLGGAFLNGQRLDLRQTEVGQVESLTGVPYDYCHWEGASTDARFFEEIVGKPPIGNYSAIYQACDVARGRSAFDVFPGTTIHDIAPSALMVELAGGMVSDAEEQRLDWQNLKGAVYAANPQILTRVVSELIKRA